MSSTIPQCVRELPSQGASSCRGRQRRFWAKPILSPLCLLGRRLCHQTKNHLKSFNMKASQCSTSRQLQFPFECQHLSGHLSDCTATSVHVPTLSGHALASPNHIPSGQVIGMQPAPSKPSLAALCPNLHHDTTTRSAQDCMQMIRRLISVSLLKHRLHANVCGCRHLLV